ncbi:MAG: Hsp20/alpha crystallin family protein [Methanoculleaceae archaeon]
MAEESNSRRDDFRERLRNLLEQAFKHSEGGRISEIRIIIPIPVTHHSAGERTIRPYTEVIVAGQTVSILVDMPGVTEDDIHINLDDGSIRISASSERFRYMTSARIPPVEADSIRSRYQNGVLEVVLSLKTDP